MTTKQRNFKKSAIDLDTLEKDKLANGAAGALESNYKNKIVELKEVKDEMMIIASKYALTFDGDKLGETGATAVIPKKYLRSVIDDNKSQDSKSYSFLNTKFSQPIEYMTTIDKFLDIYDGILKMDPRSESEKIKGYKEYAAKRLEDSTKALGVQDATNATTEVKDGALELESSSESLISLLLNEFENKNFFANLPTLDKSKLTKDILVNALKDDQSTPSEVTNEFKQEESDINTQSLPISDLSASVKLTDIPYSNHIHNNHQAEVRNIIETGKAECFETSALIQKHVIQNCKVNNAIVTSEECENLNHKADLLMKNCATMFPMHTSYDSALNEHLQLAINESDIISNDSVTHVDALGELSYQTGFSSQIIPDNAIDNFIGQVDYNDIGMRLKATFKFH